MSFERRRTLRTPRRSIISSACFSAPAPIDSIAITAPTPKIMPSIVSADRSLWTERLLTALSNDSPNVIGHREAPSANLRQGGSRVVSRRGRRVAKGDLVPAREPFLHDHAADRRRPERHRHGANVAPVRL